MFPIYISMVVRERTRSVTVIRISLGAGKPGLNLDNLRNVEIQHPSERERLEIVRRVEERMQQADTIETRYKKALSFVGKLMPSVLAKAFRG